MTTKKPAPIISEEDYKLFKKIQEHPEIPVPGVWEPCKKPKKET